MPRRYIRSYRTRKNVYRTDALRDQFLRQLTREADALMKQFNEQFAQTLQTQMSQALQGIVAGDSQVSLPTNGQPEPGTIGSIGQLLATGARYLISRPRTSRSTQETSRSYDAESAFRLSRAQALAEAQTHMQQGEKNL
jgi:hypothetical protein